MQVIALDVPTLITAGTTVKFSRSFSDYPASDGWAYSFYLAGHKILNALGVANGDAFDVTLAASGTVTLDAGTYRFTERLTKGAEVYEGGRGVMQVQMNLATAAAGDAMTHAEKCLTVIEAAIEGRLTKDMEEFMIMRRQVKRIPIDELQKLRGRYAAMVWQQRNPGQYCIPVYVRFTPPGGGVQ